MTVQNYDLATLVPKGLYAAQAREMLVAARTAIAAMLDILPTRLDLDAELRAVASSQELASVHLFEMLRVILAWPVATPDLFETIQGLGRDEIVARLDRSITRLGDVS